MNNDVLMGFVIATAVYFVIYLLARIFVKRVLFTVKPLSIAVSYIADGVDYELVVSSSEHPKLYSRLIKFKQGDYFDEETIRLLEGVRKSS